MSKKENTPKQLLKQAVAFALDEADSEIIQEFFGSEISVSPCEYALRYREQYQHYFEFLEGLEKDGIIFEHEDNYGGEGRGDDYWSVYSFTNGTEVVYVKFDGWYASYNGAEYDEWYFVEPEQKTITVFERV